MKVKREYEHSRQSQAPRGFNFSMKPGYELVLGEKKKTPLRGLIVKSEIFLSFLSPECGKNESDGWYFSKYENTNVPELSVCSNCWIPKSPSDSSHVIFTC